MNTKFEYMYRDAENYKNFHFEVISGTMTLAQIENYLHEHEFFIPKQKAVDKRNSYKNNSFFQQKFVREGH